MPVKKEGRGSRLYQERSSVHSTGLTLWKGEEKGRRNQSGQEEPQLTVTCDKISANAMKQKGAIEQLLVGQSVPLQAHSVLGLPRKSVSGLENYRRSEDTTAGDSQLIAFLVAEFVVSHFWKGDTKYCTSGTATYAWVPSSYSAWFRTLGVRNKMKHLDGAYILVEGNGR